MNPLTHLWKSLASKPLSSFTAQDLTTDTTNNLVKDILPLKETPYYYIEDQIKNVLAMGGGIYQSIKGLKAIFAILQSIAPKEFPLQWDVLFFSIYSRKLSAELSSLILERGEVEEVLWREKDTNQPFHHIYLLTKKAKRSIRTPLYDDYEKSYYSDYILWSLLEPKFPIYWSYLLEMYTYEAMPEEEKQLPFLPLLENKLRIERDATKRMFLERLQKLRAELCQYLQKLEISILGLIKPSYARKNNLYLFLPFQMDENIRDRFINFYGSGQHNKYVSIQKSENSDLLSVKIDPNGIGDIYSYLLLTKEEIRKTRMCFDITVNQFEQLIDSHAHQMLKRIPQGNEEGLLAFYRIKEAINNRREFWNNIPMQLKCRTINRAKECLSALDEFYELAQWRYDNIINMLINLAKVSQQTPINLFFENCNLKGYLNDACVDEQTMIGFEFSDDFRKNYEKKVGYEMPSDSLHHIYHFVQPGEALKAIYNRKENCLLKGGPVIGEY